MHKRTLLLLLLITAKLAVQAQTLFEDSKGESSIFLSNVPFGWVRVNSANESITLGYNRMRPGDYDGSSNFLKSYKLIYGTDFAFNLKDGLGNLVSKGKVNAGGSLNLTFGITGGDTTKAIFNPYALYVRSGVSYNKYTLIDTLKAMAADVNKWGLSFDVHFNKEWAVPTSGGSHRTFWLFGSSFGIKNDNNIDDLKDGALNATMITSGSNAVVTSQGGKLGDYKGQTTLPLKIDLGYLPTIYNANIVGFNIYSRTNFRMPDNPTNVGLGVFFSSKDKPTSVIGGIAWQFNRVFHEAELINKSSAFFYVGYTIK